MVRESVLTLATRTTLALVALASSVTLARVLGPEGRGVIALLTTIGTLMSLVGNLGISASNVYLGAQRPDLRRELVWMSLVAGGAVGGLLLLVMGALPFVVPALTKGVQHWLLLLYGLTVPLGLITGHLTGLLWGMHRVVAANLLGALAPVITLLGYLLILVPTKAVTAAVMAQLAGQVVAFAGLLWYVQRQLRNGSYRSAIRWSVLWNSVTYGLKAQVGNVMQFLNYRLDMLLVNLFLGPTNLGYYAVAVSMAEAIWMPTTSIASVLFPRVAAQQHTEKARHDASTAARFGLLTSVLIGGVLAVVAPVLVRLLFGDAFVPSLRALYGLLPGVVVFSLANVLASFTAGKGHPEYGTLAAAVSLPITIGLDLLLIPRFGILGAAVASTLAYVAATIVLLERALRLGVGSLRDLLMITRRDWLRLWTIAQHVVGWARPAS